MSPDQVRFAYGGDPSFHVENNYPYAFTAEKDAYTAWELGLGAHTITATSVVDGVDGTPWTLNFTIADGLVLEVNYNQDSSIEVKDGQDGAQSFKHSVDCTVTSVELKLSKKQSSLNDLVFNIGASKNGGALPNGAFNITSGSVGNTSEGNDFDTVVIDFDPPVALTGGVTYWLNFSTSSSNEWFLGYDGTNNYADGSYYKNGGDDGKDIWFKVSGHDCGTVNGDFDSDCDVDGDDLSDPLVGWQALYGQVYDGSHFLEWQRNYTGPAVTALAAAEDELAPAMLSASSVEQTTNDTPAVRALAGTDSTTSSSSPFGSAVSVASKSASHSIAVAARGGNLSLLIIKSRLRQASKEVRQGKTDRAERHLQELLSELKEMLTGTADTDPQRKRIEQLVAIVQKQLAKIAG